MESVNWKEIIKEVDSAKFSIIGWLFPKTLDYNIKETLELIFNKIDLDVRDKRVIKPLILMGDNKSNEKTPFTEEQVTILKNVLKNSTRDEIIARIGIILWLYKKDYEAAQKALKAYKALFNKEKSTNEINESNRLQNAFLAFKLMLGLRSKDEAIVFFTENIDKSIAEKEAFVSNNLLYFLIEQDKFQLLSDKDKSNYIAFLMIEAEDYHSAAFAGNLLVKIAQKENDKVAEKEAYLLIAKGWETIANLPESESMQKSSAMSKAADFYNRAGDEESINRCLLESQKSSRDIDDWFSRSYQIDLKLIIDETASWFVESNISQKLMLIGNFTKIPYNTVLQLHNERKSKGFTYGVFQEQSIDDNGVVRSNKKGFNGNNLDEEEPYLISLCAELIQSFSNLIYVHHRKYVLSEINQITFSEMIKTLLPENVKMIDYILNAVLSCRTEIVIESLLVTFETFLAALLEKNGFPSIKQFNGEDIQEDLSINSLLDKCDEHNLIDRDDVFLLNTLLCDKHGLNLRHRSLHRLTPDSQRFSQVYLFCGYLLIRLFEQYGDS